MEFSRQEYWSELPFPTLGNDPGIKLGLIESPDPGIKLASPALAGRFSTTVPLGSPERCYHSVKHLAFTQVLQNICQIVYIFVLAIL